MKPKSAHRAPIKRNLNKRALIIGPEEKALIAQALFLARANVLNMEDLQDGSVPSEKKVVTLADRPPLAPELQEKLRSYGIELPVGFTVAISFEQQPAGLCRHLSVAVETPGKLPSWEGVKRIAAEFGMHDPDHAWLEEFEPGHFAVNLIEVDSDGGKWKQ